MFNRLSGSNLTALVCVLLILGTTLGCKRIADLANRDRGSQTPTPTGTSETPTGGADSPSGNDLAKKTNLYISECFNKYSNRVISSHNRYAQWVKNLEQGPTGKEMNIYGLYEVSGDGSDCEKAIQSAKTLEPKMPEIEDAADKYVVALKSVLEQIQGVYKYYEQEDYKDDNFAKGKAAHPALMQAFKEFKDVNTLFADQVDALEDQVAAERLEQLRGVSGKRNEFLVIESGIKAKKIKTLLQDKQFEQITADELHPLIEDFGTTVEELQADGSKNPMAGMYIRSCESFAKASKEMMRRIRDNKPFTDFEKRQSSMGFGSTIEGSPAKVIDAYNDMIMQRRFTRL